MPLSSQTTAPFGRPHRPGSTSPSRRNRQAATETSTRYQEPRWDPSSPSPPSATTALQAREKRSLPAIGLPMHPSASSSSSTSTDERESIGIPPVPPLPFPLMAAQQSPRINSVAQAHRPVPTSPGDPFYLTRKGNLSSSNADPVRLGKMRGAMPRESLLEERSSRRPHTAGGPVTSSAPRPDARLAVGWSRLEQEEGGSRRGSEGAIDERAWKAGRRVEGYPAHHVDRATSDSDSWSTPPACDTHRAPSPGIPVGSFVHLVEGSLRSTGSASSLSSAPSLTIQVDQTAEMHYTPQKPRQVSRSQTSNGGRNPGSSELYAESSSPGSAAYVSAPSSPASWTHPPLSPLRMSTSMVSPSEKTRQSNSSPHYHTPTTIRTARSLSVARHGEPASPSFLMSPPPDISTYASVGRKSRARADASPLGARAPQKSRIDPCETAGSAGRADGRSRGETDGDTRQLGPAAGITLSRASEKQTADLGGLGFGLGVLSSPPQIEMRRASLGDVQSGPIQDAKGGQVMPSTPPPVLEKRPHHVQLHGPSSPAGVPSRPERSSRRPTTPIQVAVGASPPRQTPSRARAQATADGVARATPLETIYSEDNLMRDGASPQQESWRSLLETMAMERGTFGGFVTYPDTDKSYDSCHQPSQAFDSLASGQHVQAHGPETRLQPIDRPEASPQPSRYRVASPRLRQRAQSAATEEATVPKQHSRPEKHKFRDLFSSKTSSSMTRAPSPERRSRSTSRDEDSNRGEARSMDDPSFLAPGSTSGSPLVELKRFSRLDLAEAVSAVMAQDSDMAAEHIPSGDPHRRSRMASQLSSIQGLISEMGYSTSESEPLETAGDAGTSRNTWSSPGSYSGRRSMDDNATPRAYQVVPESRSSESVSKAMQPDGLPIPTLVSGFSEREKQQYAPWSTRHYRQASSASGHRRSASEDFDGVRRAHVQSPKEYEALPRASVPQASPAQNARPTLRHRRSTSSLDRTHYSGSTSAMRPPPVPSMQRRETFEVAATGISSLQLDQTPRDRSSMTWRASVASHGQIDELTQTHGKKEMRRQETIWELCETEAAFLADMQLVLRRFAQPLRTPQGRWIDGIDADVTRLFDWLEDIVQIHMGIHERFEAMRAEQEPLILRFAGTFKPCVAHLTIHLPYLVRFESVSRKIESLVRNPDSEIGEFIRMQTAAPECKSMSLASYLLKPVQRIMRYPLFFKQIRDLTPPDHVDHAPTLSLLHATDSVIRVMQEVKAREEELESLRQLESRIKGLPPTFSLSNRERRLLFQGVLNRVMLCERDQMRLAASYDPNGPSARLLAKPGLTSEGSRASPSDSPQHPTSPLLSPMLDQRLRPESIFSDVSTTESYVAPSTKSSESTWTDPRGSMLFRRPSMASSESSYVPGDGRKPNAPTLPHELKEQDRPKAKAKEAPLYLFVFSDLVLIVTQTNERAGLLGGRRGSSTKEKSFQITYKLVEGCGIGRALAVRDWAGRFGYNYLIEVDLLSTHTAPSTSKGKKPQLPIAMTPVSSPTANTLFLTLPERSSAKMVIAPQNVAAQSYGKWLDALRRSCITSQRTLSGSGSLSDLMDPAFGADARSATSTPNPDLVSPKKGSSGGAGTGPLMSSASMYSLEEREEREWWSRRYQAVKEEMARGSTSM